MISPLDDACSEVAAANRYDLELEEQGPEIIGKYTEKESTATILARYQEETEERLKAWGLDIE